MSGIGEATERRLLGMGITTLGALAAADPHDMELAFGVYGPRMIERAAGRERSQVLGADVEEDPKSVSNERTFPTDLTERAELVAAIRHVSALVGSRLRRKGLAGHVVTLKLRRDMSHTRTMRSQLSEMTDDEHVFGEEAVALLDRLWAEGSPVRLVGVGVSGFDDDVSFQMDLLAPRDEEADERKERLRNLSVTADEVREKFGADALSYGRDLRFGHRQPKD